MGTPNTTPVIIYEPGLGRFEANTADVVAEVLARSIDLRDRGRSCSTKSDTTITAPRGLKVGKTIVDADGSAVLQVFELDYRDRLDGTTTAAGPPPTPGIFRSTQYAVLGIVKFVAALRRRSKTLMSKLQLLYGFLLIVVLLFAWLVALYSALLAAGVDLPVPIDKVFGEDEVGWTLGISGFTSVVTWTAVRKWALAAAATVRHLIDYTKNIDRARETVTRALDEAVAGLLDNDWIGPVHLLGYSFGGLVLFDALYPQSTSLRREAPLDQVKSLVTVGLPLDVVRLFFPSYIASREARNDGLPWRNIYNAADVFGSNVQDKSDVDADPAKVTAELKPFKPTSMRYLDEKLTLLQLVMARGFRTHAGYWGTSDEGNCFDLVVDDVWLPPAAADTEAGDDPPPAVTPAAAPAAAPPAVAPPAGPPVVAAAGGPPAAG